MSNEFGNEEIVNDIEDDDSDLLQGDPVSEDGSEAGPAEVQDGAEATKEPETSETSFAEASADAVSADDDGAAEAGTDEPLEPAEPELLDAVDASVDSVDEDDEHLFLDDDDDDYADVFVVEPSEADQLREELNGVRGELEASQKESRELKSRLIRSVADFDNFRKRVNKEKDEQRKYGNDKVIGDLLPIVDNLERALQHAEKVGGADVGGLVDGVHMVLKQFVSTMQRYGVVGFESRLEKFDPEKHEAVQQVDSEDHESGTVLEVFQRGYHIHDRLLRPALVVVSRNPSEG